MEYNSTEIDDILGLISIEEQAKTDMKMKLASKIADAIKAKGIKKGELAKLLHQKNQSVVTKWLSGTHNFTSDTLFDLQNVLGVTLLNIAEQASNEAISPVIHCQIVQNTSLPATSSSVKAKSQDGGALTIRTQLGSFSKMQILA